MRFLYYGFVFGGLLAIVGFVGGFLLPIVLMPKANQGPLMAFLTGPLGFVIGVILGCIYAWRKQRQPPA